VSRGAYHFLSSLTPGKDQADAFVAYVKLHGGFAAGDLLPAIDLEWDVTPGHPADRWEDHSADEIMSNVLACLQRVKELTGKTPIVYTAKSWWTNKTVPLSRFPELKDYPVWIADYNPKRKLSETPAIPSGVVPIIWQFTDRSILATGYNGGLDASIFYGTDDEFKHKFGLGH
jgi:lysozyme